MLFVGDRFIQIIFSNQLKMQYIYMTLYKIPVDMFTSSVSRALGSVIAKFKTFKDVDFDTFNKQIILW